MSLEGVMLSDAAGKAPALSAARRKFSQHSRPALCLFSIRSFETGGFSRLERSSGFILQREITLTGAKISASRQLLEHVSVLGFGLPLASKNLYSRDSLPTDSL